MKKKQYSRKLFLLILPAALLCSFTCPASLEARVLAGSVTERKINRKIDSMLKKARKSYDSGKVKPALDLYWKILELDPAETFAYLELGEIYVNLRIYDRAIELLEPGLGMAEREMDAETVCFYYCVLTRAHLALNQSGPANQSLIRAAQASPKNPLPREILGDIYLANNRIASAYKAYKKALEYDPDFATAREKLGQLVAEHGDKLSRSDKQKAVRPGKPRIAATKPKPEITSDQSQKPEKGQNKTVEDIEPMPMPMPTAKPASTKIEDRPRPLQPPTEAKTATQTATVEPEKKAAEVAAPDPADPDDAQIEAQIDKLLAGTQEEKQASVAYFVALKDRGLNEIEELMYDSDPDVRTLAIRSLAAFTEHKKRVRNILQDATDDPDPNVKKEIELYLQQINE